MSETRKISESERWWEKGYAKGKAEAQERIAQLEAENAELQAHMTLFKSQRKAAKQDERDDASKALLALAGAH